MVWFDLVAGALALAGAVSILDGLALKGRPWVPLRLALYRGERLGDQAERWLHSQS